MTTPVDNICVLQQQLALHNSANAAKNNEKQYKLAKLNQLRVEKNLTSLTEKHNDLQAKYNHQVELFNKKSEEYDKVNRALAELQQTFEFYKIDQNQSDSNNSNNNNNNNNNKDLSYDFNAMEEKNRYSDAELQQMLAYQAVMRSVTKEFQYSITKLNQSIENNQNKQAKLQQQISKIEAALPHHSVEQHNNQNVAGMNNLSMHQIFSASAIEPNSNSTVYMFDPRFSPLFNKAEHFKQRINDVDKELQALQFNENQSNEEEMHDLNSVKQNLLVQLDDCLNELEAMQTNSSSLFSPIPHITNTAAKHNSNQNDSKGSSEADQATKKLEFDSSDTNNNSNRSNPSPNAEAELDTSPAIAILRDQLIELNNELSYLSTANTKYSQTLQNLRTKTSQIEREQLLQEQLIDQRTSELINQIHSQYSLAENVHENSRAAVAKYNQPSESIICQVSLQQLVNLELQNCAEDKEMLTSLSDTTIL
jgi:DNA repair exonuclease SbcCD ATPase subunit